MDKETLKRKAIEGIEDAFIKIGEYEALKEMAVEEKKAEYNTILGKIMAQREELRIKYNEALHNTEDKWAEFQEVFNSSMDSFKEGFAKLTSLLK